MPKRRVVLFFSRLKLDLPSSSLIRRRVSRPNLQPERRGSEGGLRWVKVGYIMSYPWFSRILLGIPPKTRRKKRPVFRWFIGDH